MDGAIRLKVIDDITKYICAFLLCCWGGFTLHATSVHASTGTTPTKTKSSQNAKTIKSKQKRSKAKPKRSSKKRLSPNRTEFSLLPVINYSTDRGFGFGAYSVIAKFKEGYDPYLWRLYFRLSATVKNGENGERIFPYHEDFVRVDLPGLAGGKLRINARAGFFRFLTTGYFGFGNASVLDKGKPRKYYQFDRIYPEAMLITRYRLKNIGKAKVNAFFSGNLLYNITNVLPGSKLAADINQSLKADTPESQFLADMLRGLRAHPQLSAHVGLMYDSRDSEFAPTSGMLHEISIRGGTAFTTQLSYLGLNAKTHFYLSIWKEYLVFAARFIGDVLLGNPPFYELYRYGGLFPDEGPGGGLSVRGTLPQRYYGKMKLVGNVELRSMIFTIRLLSQVFKLGLVAFADAGRVWGDLGYASQALQEQIDGSGLGMKLGFGMGGRLQWGSTVVMRADFAYSPTDQNVGFFFLLGHLF